MTDRKSERRKSFDAILHAATQKAINDSLAEIQIAMDAAYDHLAAYPVDEVGWLIEWADNDAPAPRWWHPVHGWVWDADKAIRFAREVDAADFAKFQRINGKATEHVWC